MKVTVSLLVGAGVSAPLARDFAVPLQNACERFAIDTQRRISHFLAQAIHESNGFRSVVENLNYSSPERICAVFPGRIKTLAEARELVRNPRMLANRVYSGRLGNGSIESGDGWKFIGRGLFQLTGKANYEAASRWLYRPYTEQPDLVCQPEDAALTSAWFWDRNRCNGFAAADNCRGVTRMINGAALLGLEERTALVSKISALLENESNP